MLGKSICSVYVFITLVMGRLLADCVSTIMIGSFYFLWRTPWIV